MKNHRISTTISQKHWELLNKHAEKFETQQKVLEYALESLEKSSKQSPVLTREEEFWMRTPSAKSGCIVEKEYLNTLFETADIELLNDYVTTNKPMEYIVEYYLEKPIKECTLKEIIEGLLVNYKISNWFETVDYTDDRDHYTLKITHRLGHNASKLAKMESESVFNTYGVKAESVISERTIFMKIFKN